MKINSTGSCCSYNLYAGQAASSKAQPSGAGVPATMDDSVSISSEAKLLNAVKIEEDINGDGTVTVDEVRASLDQNIEEVRGIMEETLKSLDISSSGRFKVDIDPFNRVIVTGGTDEENSEIAAALQEDDRFQNAWKQTSNDATMLAMIGPVTEFQKAYAADPKAAVSEFGWLFNKNWDFDMSYEDGRIDYSVA